MHFGTSVMADFSSFWTKRSALMNKTSRNSTSESPFAVYSARHSPDRQHSASSGLNVLHIGGRDVRVAILLHGFV